MELIEEFYTGFEKLYLLQTTLFKTETWKPEFQPDSY